MSNPTLSDPTTNNNTSSQEFTTVPIDNNNNDDDQAPTAKTNTTTTTANNNNKEKTSNRMMRTTKNAWRRAVGCCKKSTPRTKMHLKEHQIIKRKKAFGMEYMDLLRSSKEGTQNEEKLQQIVQACMQDIDALEAEISELEHQIDQVSEQTKSQLKPKPMIGSNQKPIYPESGLYAGGDPTLDLEEPTKPATAPPETAFSITSAEDDNDNDDDEDSSSSNNPDKESWLPPPPSTPPPAVPAAV